VRVTTPAAWSSPEMRGLSRANFTETVEREFARFEVAITEPTEEAYRHMLTCEAAKKHREVVYLYRSTRPVPRLVGQSDILYVGQTVKSFQQRYGRYAAHLAAIRRNARALELYGPIRISACHYSVLGRTLLEAENQVLWWYYQSHFEYPPFNYTRAKAPQP
jgi:hypothetical protein